MIINISKDLAETLLSVCQKLQQEAYYQLNDAPYPHDPEALAVWESDLRQARLGMSGLWSAMNVSEDGDE
jgi:hypothetical protein